MEFLNAIETARRAVGVERVFGDPVERDGITVLPAATVFGGGGGGGGQDAEGAGGGGTGFGLRARPAGAYVIRDGEVTWRPAIDVNRLVVAIAAVAITYLVTRVRRERLREAERGRSV